jgi:hypothetical protein
MEAAMTERREYIDNGTEVEVYANEIKTESLGHANVRVKFYAPRGDHIFLQLSP